MIIEDKRHLDRKLLFHLHFLFTLFIVNAIIISYDILVHAIDFLLALSGILMGVGLGFLAGRINRIKWHEEKKKVIITMDRLGIIILVSYIFFEYFRNRLFGHWLEGAALTAFGFSLLGGMMYGRYLSLRLDIDAILKEKKSR
ncbi:hypothetical protein HY496_03520 [Candidatus Woesearchaeota archaeon]|nr:hypothetical protein [Candidatus Woesearchaeota archaeon]